VSVGTKTELNDPELDKELNDAEILSFVEQFKDIDTQSLQSVHTHNSKISTRSRAKEIDTLERVKALAKRSSSVGAKSNRSLVLKINEKIMDKEIPDEQRSIKLNKDINPILEKLSNQFNYEGKSKSVKSIVHSEKSNLSNYVIKLKGELEKEKHVKDRAINILKNLRSNTTSFVEIDKFLRDI